MSKYLQLAVLFGAMGGMFAAQGQQIPDLKIGNESIQIHAFGSQGFLGSDENNFLTMKTSQGSFAMTDFAVNVSSQLTDKLRIGAQMYDYNVGQLGKWHPSLDWGYLDYKFKDYLGIRAGKVKTALGLYNDTQDTTFLYTWALMPQSIYPLDLRSTSIAHLGGDIYGHVGLKKAGSLDYVGYYGYVPFDPDGGGTYAAATGGGMAINNIHRTGGEDIRWNTPVPGLMLGNSIAIDNGSAYGRAPANYGGFPYHLSFTGERTMATYGDYVRSKWHFSGEFRSVNLFDNTTVGAGNISAVNLGSKAAFVGIAYRLSKRLELGTYNSRIYFNKSQTPLNSDSNHIFDQVVTARIDLASFWNVKIEGHFMNGYGDVFSSRGFYAAVNPNGLKPDTNMIVIRTGVNF